MEEHVLEAALHGVGKVHFALSDFSERLTRLAEGLHHARRKMPRQTNLAVWQHLHALIAAQRFEETVVEVKVSVPQTDYLAKLVAEPVGAIGREPHDLTFVSVLGIADELANH